MKRKERVLGVLSFVPILYMGFFVCFLLWWFFVFDPSRGTNARAALLAFYALVVVHGTVMLLMLGLSAYFIYIVKAAPNMEEWEKVFWSVALITVNLIAYPVFYFLYVRPALRSSDQR